MNPPSSFFFLFVERYAIQPNVSIEWEAAMLSQESRKSLNLTNKQKKSLNLVIIACLLIIHWVTVNLRST